MSTCPPSDARPAVSERISVQAALLGERLDTRRFEREQPLALAPLTVRIGECGFAVLFRYGAVVLFGLSADEERRFLAEVRPLVSGAVEVPETEDAELVIDPAGAERVGADGTIYLRELEPERLQAVADVLAKSVVLAHYENTLASVFERVEPLATSLRQGRQNVRQAKELLREIGDVLLTRHKMVGHVEVLEKPELLWEHPELERLYVRLMDEYELRERDRALNRKLDLISATVATILDLDQHKRSLRVEWYIVILIVIEILLSLYEMWFR